MPQSFLLRTKAINVIQTYTASFHDASTAIEETLQLHQKLPQPQTISLERMSSTSARTEKTETLSFEVKMGNVAWLCGFLHFSCVV